MLSEAFDDVCVKFHQGHGKFVIAFEWQDIICQKGTPTDQLGSQENSSHNFVRLFPHITV